jgi:hypothetical protein
MQSVRRIMFYQLNDEDQEKLDLLFNESEANKNPEISDILLEARMLCRAILLNILPNQAQDRAIQKLHEIIQILGSATVHGFQ